MMEVLYAHCTGLDVHKRSVVACVCQTDRRGARHVYPPDLWHHHAGALGPASRARHPRGHGSDGILLEAGLQRPSLSLVSFMAGYTDHLDLLWAIGPAYRKKWLLGLAGWMEQAREEPDEPHHLPPPTTRPPRLPVAEGGPAVSRTGSRTVVWARPAALPFRIP